MPKLGGILNPTARDVQMAAIIDQCSGKKATKVIAKRRIEFISGNVNSYARILNGPQQLQRIKTFNDLSASIAALEREKDELEAKAREEKKLKDAEKDARVAEKRRKADDERARLGPGCKEGVEKGIDHVLAQTNLRRKLILKHHFGKSGLSGLRLEDTEKLLRELMGGGVEPNGNENNNETGDEAIENDSNPTEGENSAPPMIIERNNGEGMKDGEEGPV